MIYQKKNYSRGKLSNLSVSNGDTFIECNFSQLVAGTEIANSYTGLTFEKCNLMNCEVPGDAVVERCLTVEKSCCSHLHPGVGLTTCSDNCSHVVDTDEIWIDGVLIDTVYYYKDTII